MTSRDTAALAFLGFTIGLIVALVLFLGDEARDVHDVWTPQTIAPAVPTEVDDG